VKLPRAVFFTTLGLTAVAGVVAGIARLQLAGTQANFTGHFANGEPHDEDVSLYHSLKRDGDTWAAATNGMLLTAGLLALATVVCAVLVDWSN
jgi:hypothetical protein